MALRLPAQLLAVIAAFLSTLVCSGGGVLVHLSALRVLADTMDSLGAAESGAFGRELLASFLGAQETSRQYEGMLLHGNLFYAPPGLSTWEQLQVFFERDAFLRVRHSQLQAAGLLIVPLDNTSGNPDGLAAWVWREPLGPRSDAHQYVSSFYLPSHWGHRSCSGPGGRCVSAYRLSPDTGRRGSNIYNYSDGTTADLGSDGLPQWAAAQRGWQSTGAAWWAYPGTPEPEGGTAYMNAALMNVLPLRFGQPFVPTSQDAQYKLVVSVRIVFATWEVALRRSDTGATIIAAFLNDGLDSLVLATNADVPTGEGCAAAGAEGGACVRTLRALAPAAQAACVRGNLTEEGRAVRATLDGDDHWLRRLVIRSMRETDAMPTSHLIWLYPAGELEDDVHRSLYVLIAILAGVFVFDAAMIFVGLRLVARPLRQLEHAMEPMDRMDLAEAEQRLEDAGPGKGCCRQPEMDLLFERLGHTLDALRSYKAFLPQSCLQDSSDNEEEVDVREQVAAFRCSHPDSIAPALAFCEPQPRRDPHYAQSPLRGSLVVSVTSATELSGCHSAPTPTATSVCFSATSDSAARCAPGVQVRCTRSRKVTLLAANRCDVLKTQPGNELTAMMICNVVSRLAQEVQLERGSVELISGDRGYASFAASRSCPRHRMAGTRCAWGLRAMAAHELLHTSAVVSGLTLCGDFGNCEMKRFMFVGGLYCCLLVLERVAARGRIPVLVDSRVYQEVGSRWHCQLVDRLLYPKLQPAPFDVWRVTDWDASDRDSTEWKGALSGTMNPFETYNKVLAKVLLGEHGTAADILGELLGSGAGKLPEELVPLFQDLEKRLSSGPQGQAMVSLVHEVHLELTEDETL
eukprot:TRINITY_DN4413_c0_g1_i4.p1 TRINITY_DN4413_c0_g1~~TRINITY_DN4413_c0_g1_i4.p1  ORF type:complete len:886 (+),score=240.78 TRINITY_DN4413_c0_g1_i4:90-2660(+)